MALIVQKYGGKSLSTLEHIKNVARRVIAAKDGGYEVIAVVSAMSGETSRLLELLRQVSDAPDERERDVMLASGEQVSAALLAIAIKDLGQRARSFLGHQIRIETDRVYGKASIKSVDSSRVIQALRDGEIVVVAGFQGVDQEDNITTLGRGGGLTPAPWPWLLRSTPRSARSIRTLRGCSPPIQAYALLPRK